MATAEREHLQVRLHDEHIGRLERHPAGVRFAYAPEVVDRHGPGLPLLSCSLPVDTRLRPAAAFFDGLLPEGPHRAALAAEADVAASDTFGLLARYGRDIAGAVVIEPPEGAPHRTPRVAPLDDVELAQELAALPERALGVHDDSELSLAGLQDKLLLVALGDGRWGRPIGGYPSTHLVKIDPRRFPGVVRAEAQCMALARAVGLTSVDAVAASIDGIDCLIVERYDRRRVGREVRRVHQEDACQALGVLPTSKYEVRHGGGGPELSQIAGLLDRHAADPLAELDRLAAIATFTALIGNADAHGKNLALLHPEGGVVTLAPLYDQVPTGMWSKLQADAAMTIGGALNLDIVTPATIAAEAKRWRHSPSSAARVARSTAEAVLLATGDGTIDPGGDVARFVRARAQRFVAS
jgi:serine/threonine-protein kinase HipA